MVVSVFHTLKTTGRINSHLRHIHVFLLDIALCTRVIDVCILQLKEFTYLVMSSLMKNYFPYVNSLVKKNCFQIPIEMASFSTSDACCETSKN